jgi:antirestriction protein ArdC
MSSFDLYQTVTDQIVAMLETGVVPWRSPILGRSKAGHPKNMNTGKQYRGVNVFLLAFTAFAKGYGSSYWLTFNQAKERGGNVRKGEKSSMVVFWKQYETTDKETGQPTKIPVLRYYNVFNAEQLEGVEIPDAVKFEPLDFKPIESAEQIVVGYLGGPSVSHDGGQQAFYRPISDTVHMPERTRFASVEEYYSRLFPMTADSRRSIVPFPILSTCRTGPGLRRWRNTTQLCFTSFPTRPGTALGLIGNSTPPPNRLDLPTTERRNWLRKCPPRSFAPPPGFSRP